MNEQNYPVEHERLQFLIDRDGESETVKFAKGNMESYRHIVLKGFHFRGIARGCPPQLREGFIRSYLDFKRYARRGITVEGETVDGEGS